LEVALAIFLTVVVLLFGFGNGSLLRSGVLLIEFLAFGFLFGWWVVRKAHSGFLLHGLLVGVLATCLYLALISALLPGGIAADAANYGMLLFILFNAFRIVGCVAGSVVAGRR